MMRNLSFTLVTTAIINLGYISVGTTTAFRSVPSFVLAVPSGGGDGGSSSDDQHSRQQYDIDLEVAKCKAIERAYVKIEEARRKIVDECTTIPDFGSKADEICSLAMEEFMKSIAALTTTSDTIKGASYARKLRELESALDTPLQVLYLHQLGLHRDDALAYYRTAGRTTADGSDYESMLAADAMFVRLAESSTRPSSSWTYDKERRSLQSVMSDVASASRKLVDVQVKGSAQQSTAMQFLQQQQQMIQQLQQQLYGQSSPWNVGVAYRIPDTNFNLQGSYQQGRANVQLSCVPDEYAPMLGPNGFTNGVGPGNLGLSLNLSI